MHNFKLIIIKNINLLKNRCYSTLKDKRIIIASAVRTPIGLFRGNLSGISVQRLGATAIAAALQRAGCSANYVDAIYMGNTLAEKEIVHEAVKLSGLSNNVSSCTFNNDCLSGIESIIEAFKTLNDDKGTEVIVAGGMELMSNEKKNFEENSLNESSELACSLLLRNAIITGITTQNQWSSFVMGSNNRLQKALLSNAFELEIEPLRFRNKGVFVNVTKDDVYEKSNVKTCEDRNNIKETNVGNLGLYTDGGCALVLMTPKKAKEISCRPLAKVLGYADEQVESNSSSASYKAINELLINSRINKSQIALMQINELTSVIDSKNIFEDINKINIHGDFSSSGGFTGAQSVTHLIHTLKGNQLGCALISTNTRAMAILIEKLPNHLPPGKTLPTITLYTKEPCPLCDELINELEFNFKGSYELVKIFIDDLKNEKYLDLYKYDIPVLFFNGQYLCKHRLNKDLLNQKLIELKLCLTN